MSDFDFSQDSTQDPPVDKELRAFIQLASAKPNPEEMQKFWGELSQKLPEQQISKRRPFLARIPVKIYMPLATACGVAVLLMVLPLSHSETDQVASVPSFSLEKTDDSDASRNRAQKPKRTQKPMVLGAPPLQQDTKIPADLVGLPDQIKAQLQSLPLVWVKLSTHAYTIHVPLENNAVFLATLEHWPKNLRLKPESVLKKQGYKTYLLELKSR